MDLIDRKALLERMNGFAAFAATYKSYMSKDDVAETVLKQVKAQGLRLVEEAPTVKAVSFDSEYIKQILWERDVALQQLSDIGCELGRDMTDIKEKIEAASGVYGSWIGNGFDCKCSVCGYHEPEMHVDFSRKYHKFCMNCGARMDGKVVNE